MSNYQSEMKVPIRPAPPPPVNQKVTSKSCGWESFSKDSWNKSTVPIQKKKPPPRPPPPKLPNKKAVPSRPTQLIAGLFHRKTNNVKTNEVHINRPTFDITSEPKKSNRLLIDFNSPPSSPTFTTRSSSDALSVNSFGSDGVTQGSGSSGNTSNVESGFEDDFDIFSNGGVSKKVDTFQPRDPWSPLPNQGLESKPLNGKSWTTFPLSNSSKKIPETISSMPTIIRSKPEGLKANVKVNNCDKSSSVDLLADVFRSTSLSSAKPSFVNSIFEEEDDGWSSESPPMPTCPPPPPPEVVSDILKNLNNMEASPKGKPSGIALYNYQAEQPDDLSFKKDDIITLVRRIDENWLVGKLGGREGNVPANFIFIQVPLPGEESGDVFVTALYKFQPETWDDLEFDKGSVIKVIERIDQDWFYGECNGKSGQFPVNFVDRVPSGVPDRRTY